MQANLSLTSEIAKTIKNELCKNLKWTMKRKIENAKKQVNSIVPLYHILLSLLFVRIRYIRKLFVI